MGLGERAKPSNSSVSTTRIRPLSGPHWPWMLLQALSALRSGPRLQHLVQLHIRTDCGPQGHQLKNPSTTVGAQFARLQLSQWDRHRGTQCASVRCSIAKCALSPAHPCKCTRHLSCYTYRLLNVTAVRLLKSPVRVGRLGLALTRGSALDLEQNQ